MRPACSLPALCALAIGDAACHPAARRDDGAPAPERPNIIVIQTDDQDLASLAARRPDTGAIAYPRIRSIGERGARFENAFASLPLCCPSRATLLTGQYAHNHRVLGNVAPEGGFAKLDHSETLPVWLQRAGYYTLHVGKYLNGYSGGAGDSDGGRGGAPPGWDQWYTLSGDGAGSYFDCEVDDNGVLTAIEPGLYQTDALMQRAASYLADRPFGDRPFFLLLDPIAPHATFADPSAGPIPAPRHEGAFARYEPPAAPAFDEEDVSDKPRAVRGRKRLSQDDVEEIRVRQRRRLESLLAVDEGVGLVLDTLERTGLAANTVVIFVSDNGFMAGEHRIRSAKQVVYDECIRVPLLVCGPGVPARATVSKVVGNVDLAPTILDLARATAGLPQDGRSLWPLLAGEDVPWRPALLLENPVGERYRGLRSEQFKYIEYDYDGDGLVDERELYDFVAGEHGGAADPFELASQHDRDGKAALIESLHEHVERLSACSGGSCW